MNIFFSTLLGELASKRSLNSVLVLQVLKLPANSDGSHDLSPLGNSLMSL